MLKAVRGAIGSFQIFSILLLAMVFTAPAFESHACPAPQVEAAVSAEAAPSSVSADERSGCPECGPTCAGGCCHAPHPGMTADLAPYRSPVAFDRESPWPQSLSVPAGRPTGPERPPQI